jgi:hypothetical protein
MTDAAPKIHIKSEDFIKLSDNAWKFLNIDLSGNSTKWTSPCRKFLKRALFFINVSILTTYSFTAYCGVYRTPNDLEKFTIGVANITMIVLEVVKYFCIFINEENLNNILKTLDGNYTKADCEKYGIDQRVKGFKKFIKRYFMYVLLPLVTFFQEPISTYMETGLLILPFTMQFPFEINSSFRFFLVMFIVFWIDLMHLCVLIGSDNIMYGIIHILALEFDILKIKIEELSASKEADFRKELKNHIERHKQLIAVTDEIQGIFSIFFNMNFLVSSVYICFTALLCSVSDSLPKTVFYIAFLAFSMLQVFMQCFFCQMLRDSSESVNYGIYNCGWEQIDDLQLKKDFVLLLARSQKPTGLSILNFSAIKLDQFTNVSLQFIEIFFITFFFLQIVRTSYSYFTLCRHLYSKA